MELGEKLERGWRRSTEGLLIFAVLLGFGFFINREVELKGLYMDDLYLWSCYGEQSFMEYVFPMGGSRFRFVFCYSFSNALYNRIYSFADLPQLLSHSMARFIKICQPSFWLYPSIARRTAFIISCAL